MRILMTHISLKEQYGPGPDSAREYRVQQDRVREGYEMQWKDVPQHRGGNKAVMGDLCGFVFNNRRVVFHHITRIKESEGGRNLIWLSYCKVKLPVAEYPIAFFKKDSFVFNNSC